MKHVLLCLSLLLAGTGALAEEITLLATMGQKALIRLDGKQQTLSIGQQRGNIKLLRLDADSAVFEVAGKQRRLTLGEGYVVRGGGAPGSGTSIILSPDQQKHYYTEIAINGRSANGVIDTGATHLSMTSAQARHLGINYEKGMPARSQTANGVVKAWIVQIPELRFGNVLVYNVPVAVRDSNEDIPVLIGASLLNRFQMKREQDTMILTKKNY
ncbi:TIGR02281 family clan AA aspartic protease [Chitiniphilus purpureus]|uniref:TIGR02281 family clan AA aspartic protease n=1 Tax=Chitiniphilus purpureus TaxID=2981137 RepID=A0ABY6DLT5_9NEIS|nr:TIGR02281 family clan AA aspartic protease [Chitiniphilus sp. CD1]UXY15335.1 TIGR02281 family clan AA aspartic protease [Chitiniphilus sp. CD1]